MNYKNIKQTIDKTVRIIGNITPIKYIIEVPLIDNSITKYDDYKSKNLDSDYQL